MLASRSTGCGLRDEQVEPDILDGPDLESA
jgi:hypothetical protein